MIERFVIKKFFLYPFINRLKLWGGLIFLHRFARRGMFFGYLCGILFGCFAIALMGAFEYPLRALVEIGLPHWIHVFAFIFYLFPVTGLFVIDFDLFYVGFRAPNQFIFGSAFWSESHETRWQAYMSWLEEQKIGSKEASS